MNAGLSSNAITGVLVLNEDDSIIGVVKNVLLLDVILIRFWSDKFKDEKEKFEIGILLTDEIDEIFTASTA